MDRGAWQATAHGVAKEGHNLATKPPPISFETGKNVNLLPLFFFKIVLAILELLHFKPKFLIILLC